MVQVVLNAGQGRVIQQRVEQIMLFGQLVGVRYKSDHVKRSGCFTVRLCNGQEIYRQHVPFLDQIFNLLGTVVEAGFGLEKHVALAGHVFNALKSVLHDPCLQRGQSHGGVRLHSFLERETLREKVKDVGNVGGIVRDPVFVYEVDEGG